MRWWLMLVIPGLIGLGACRFGFQVSDAPGADIPRDGGAVEHPPLDQSRTDAPRPGFKLQAFKSSWTLPNTVAWVWQCSGKIPAFDHFELCVDTDPGKLASGSAGCREPTTSYSLGILDCVSSPWPMVAIFDLEPLTTYHARLYIHDKTGLTHASAVASATTTATPTGTTLIFDEDQLPGMWLLDLTRSKTKPHSGSWGLVSTIGDTHWHNLHVGGLSLTFPGITPARFAAGYREMFLDVPQPVQVCGMVQHPNNELSAFCAPGAFVEPDGTAGYQRIQIPLAQFVFQPTQGPMTLDQLKTVEKVMLGASFGKGTLYLDDINFVY